MRDRDALREGWEDVIATRDSAPADCPCRAVTAPLIAAWLTWDRSDTTIDEQWLNLRAARAAQAAPGALAPRVGDFAIDVRTPAECAKKPRAGAVNIPGDELEDRLAEVPLGARVVVYCASGQRARRAVHLLRERGYKACNGHEPVCEIPEPYPTKPYQTERSEWATGGDWPVGHPSFGLDLRRKEPNPDPRMGGVPDALMGVFSGLTQGLGGVAGGAVGEAAKSAIPGVAAAVKGEVPGVAQTIKGEVPGVVAVAGEAAKGAVPGVVQAAGSAARPVATSIAGEAGEAAGRGVAGGAKGAAAGMAPVVVVGVVAVVAAVLGIGYAASQKERKRP